jgi:DNA helicase IV
VGLEPTEEVFYKTDDMVDKFITDFSNEAVKVEKSIGIIVFESTDFKFNDVKNCVSEIEIGGKKNNFIELDPKQKTAYIPNGVYLMRAEDCKGLEFSKVYVLNLNLKKIKSFPQARKAFVAVTRAMNELSVYGVK